MSETLYPHETVVGKIIIWFCIGVGASVAMHHVVHFLVVGGF